VAESRDQAAATGFLSLAPFEARTINTVTLYTDMPDTGHQLAGVPARVFAPVTEWPPPPPTGK
jgi:hypothetical protein